MQSGQWTKDGSADALRLMAVQTKETGERGLLNLTRRNIRLAAAPAVEAVPAYERDVLPKQGGLNEWIASTPVRVSILTGARSAGVRLRQSKRGGLRPHDLRRMNDEGLVRHPTFGRRDKPQDWQTTKVPVGFWEAALEPTRAAVTAAMIVVLREAAVEAGFD